MGHYIYIERERRDQTKQLQLGKHNNKYREEEGNKLQNNIYKIEKVGTGHEK